MARRGAAVVLKSVLAPLAARAEAPVFAALGAGGSEVVERLRLRPDIRLVDSPRHAAVLLVAGRFPPSLLRPLLRVHDQLGHPRVTVLACPGGAGGLGRLFPYAVQLEDEGLAANTIVRAHQELVSGARPTEPAIQPDVDPAPWRGVGPYGQGGKGMTGGVPYGRPLTGLADDRDGLKLDQLRLRVGPFFPVFPPGLTLDLALQGDVVQEAVVAPNPFLAPGLATDPFRRAFTEPVPIDVMERARVVHHLRSTGRLLDLYGLRALAERCRRLAARPEPAAPDEIRGLRRLLERTRFLTWSSSGVGVVERDAVAGRGLGPTARAAGLVEDGRLDDPAYTALGFEPVAEKGGDVCARWRQRLAEAAQSAALAKRAEGRRSGAPSGPARQAICDPAGARSVVESPWGEIAPGHSPVTGLLELVPGLLEGRPWEDAMAILVSLDLDLEEEARS